MKKKLFLALLTTLLLLLAATTALAESPSDYNCLVCGEPCTFWFPFRSGDGITMCHVPGCNSCLAAVWSAEIPCTPDESTATCIIPAKCSVCGHIDRLGATNPNAHADMCEWKYNSTTQHYRYCLDCFADASIEYEDHYGGTATCTEDGVCVVCKAAYIPAIQHAWGEWQSNGDGTHTRVCRNDAEHTETGNCSSSTATCTGKAICNECGGEHAAAITHWYGLWHPEQNGTHSAECRRDGCSHEGAAECTLYEVTVKDGDAETILTFCPVCGDHERAALGVVNGAVIRNVFTHQPLPAGEQIVRGLESPFDGVLYAFTAAYESSGRVMPFNGKVSVSLTLDAEKYAEFRLVRVDVTPATETTGRTEVWTDVAFTFENGRLTFDTYDAGLFLLVPVQ